MIFVGIIAGLIFAFVKWGAEHPFPPRSPIDFFAAACKVDITGLSQDQILQVCSLHHFPCIRFNTTCGRMVVI